MPPRDDKEDIYYDNENKEEEEAEDETESFVNPRHHRHDQEVHNGGYTAIGRRTLRTRLSRRICFLSSCSLLALVVFLSSRTNVANRSHDNHGITSNNNSSSSSSSIQILGRTAACTWAPGHNEECVRAIQSLCGLCPPTEEEDDNNNNDNHPHENDQTKIPRLLLFGDSTMERLFRWARMRPSLVSLEKKHTIKQKTGVKCKLHDPQERCHLNEQFGLPYPVNQTWIPPHNATRNNDTANVVWEGPCVFGLENPFCQDCRGCFSAKIDCKPLEEEQQPPITGTTWDQWLSSTKISYQDRKDLFYGGFLGVEFARDVELQTDRFQTTQENVAHYLQHTWNDPSILQIWQKPTCLVNTAHHDVLIPGITLDAYVANVQWYLHLLHEPCRDILWLATTAPQDDSYRQKVETTRTWGLAVRQMLQQDALLREKSLYIDVFEASRTFPHHDNSTY
eukprot:scaffold7729_cov172-Amphora_coffeaeformis.AAC.2